MKLHIIIETIVKESKKQKEEENSILGFIRRYSPVGMFITSLIGLAFFLLKKRFCGTKTTVDSGRSGSWGLTYEYKFDIVAPKK